MLKPGRQSEAFPGYQFGLNDEEASEAVRLPLDDLPVLDDDGNALFDISVDQIPSTTRLVTADIVIRLQEAGGRAVERILSLPVKPDSARIGIKPEFTGDLPENSVANFHVIALDQDSKRTAMADLSWKLFKVEQDYQWYREGSAWRYEPVNRTSQDSSR